MLYKQRHLYRHRLKDLTDEGALWVSLKRLMLMEAWKRVTYSAYTAAPIGIREPVHTYIYTCMLCVLLAANRHVYVTWLSCDHPLRSSPADLGHLACCSACCAAALHRCTQPSYLLLQGLKCLLIRIQRKHISTPILQCLELFLLEVQQHTYKCITS